VREALKCLFELQDGGFPPEGRFTSLEGAIGTTGPRWMNSTGSAIALAADYIRCSRDKEFAEEYLPRILRGADWILREIRATRVLNPDGTRPATYGLMPFGCSTDGDTGFVIMFSDSYTWWGLDNVAALLTEIGHERAAELAEEAARYYSDIAAAIDHLARPDGRIERAIRVEGDDICTKFDLLVSAVHPAQIGAIDTDSDVFERFVEYAEKNVANGYFAGPMDRDVFYVGVNERAWQLIYLRRGEWKKAFAAAQNSLRYAITPGALLVQERFSKSNPAYTPWQPNGSGSGRAIEVILDSIYFEQGECVTILGGMPYAWLEDNGVTSVTGLRTPHGVVDIRAAVDGDCCRVEISTQHTGKLPRTIRVPDHFSVKEASNGLTSRDNGYFDVSEGALSVSLTLVDGEKPV